MTDDRSLERAARSWLENGPTEAPDRAVEAALLRIQTTPQERDLRIPWRFPKMTTPARVATAAVIGVLVVGGALFALGRPGQTGVGGPAPTATSTPTATPTPTQAPTPVPSPTTSALSGLLKAGTYTVASTAGPRITFTVPDGWEGAPFDSIWLPDANNSAPDGAGMIFDRGGRLSSDPCGGTWDIPVGPSADDFANALAEHPTLKATKPVGVTLDGYSGKFVEFTAPADLAGCGAMFPWEDSLYVQGPSQGWHLWILDVDGTRLVVQTNTYPETTAQHLAELEAIVHSMQIEP